MTLTLGAAKDGATALFFASIGLVLLTIQRHRLQHPEWRVVLLTVVLGFIVDTIFTLHPKLRNDPLLPNGWLLAGAGLVYLAAVLWTTTAPRKGPRAIRL